MFKPDFTKTANGSVAKLNMLNTNPLGYVMLSVLAGAFIGVGVLLAFTIGGLMAGAPSTKVIMGLSFGVALSLVVMAGAELFTGNNMAMAMGMLEKKVTFADTIKLWVICWLGNLAGGIILGIIYHCTGLGVEAVGTFMATAAAGKMGAGPLALLTRGMLCNFLVCLAVWCAGRATSDAGKLLMVFWCLFAFITTGFEHSVANMTLFTVAVLEPMDQAVSVGGAFYNLGLVTLGNIIGGALMVAVPYHLASRKDSIE